jgi:DNA polymerase-1
MATPSVLLIDAHALIHRAFHALPPLSGPDGQPTGALYGLARALLKVLGGGRFTHVFAAFDRPEPTFRKQAFTAYKAQRPKAPDELVRQLIEARTFFQALGIPVVEQAGVEADDIIGTLATRFANEGASVTIFTGDLDTLQLIRDPFIVVETFKRGVSEMVVYDEAAVRARYGFPPGTLTDWKGLVGDTSDNIPGVPGVGPKTAEALLKEFGSLEQMFQKMPKSHRLAKKVLPYKKDALLAKTLATIKTDVPLTISLADGRFDGPHKEALRAYFARMGFESLMRFSLSATTSRDTSPVLAFPTDFPPGTVFIRSGSDARENLARLRGEEEKVAYEWKVILKELGENAGNVRGPLFDLSVAGWLLDPEEKDVSREGLFARFLPKETANDAALFHFLKEQIAAEGLTKVFREIEMPLVPILAALERNGIAIAAPRLAELAKTVKRELGKLEVRIYREAGVVFNVNSPRQVAEVFFERLKLSPTKPRRTKTGQSRTGRDILLELGGSHPIVPLLLEYRESFKILSSFIEPLTAAIGRDGRVHTTFLQTGTATGRLASENPNLQNIPQESRWAEPLRSAFVAPRGKRLVSFDYSQLELRLLAHTSHDPALEEAFREGKDIHRLTAARVFNVTPDRVIPSMRRTAKTLNFGIVYGMGARAFAAASGFALHEAKRFIEEYFRQFPGVREWQERVKREARTFGSVTNENGRRRSFRSAVARGRTDEIDRAAVNMPLQSLGADIIKRAMVEADAMLKEGRGETLMVLSIHDELLFEVPEGMLNSFVPELRKRMESITQLSVPLAVDAKVGPHWGAMAPFAPDTHRH